MRITGYENVEVTVLSNSQNLDIKSLYNSNDSAIIQTNKELFNYKNKVISKIQGIPIIGINNQ